MCERSCGSFVTTAAVKDTQGHWRCAVSEAVHVKRVDAAAAVLEYWRRMLQQQ